MTAICRIRISKRTGFGGDKQACFDTVTFRIVTEPGARVAGMQTGELQGVEDIPTKSIPQLKNNKNITLLPLPNWWIQIAEAEHGHGAHRQSGFPQGGPGGSEHGSHYAGRDRWQLSIEHRISVSEPSRTTAMPARAPTICTIRSWLKSISRSPATRVNPSFC